MHIIKHEAISPPWQALCWIATSSRIFGPSLMPRQESEHDELRDTGDLAVDAGGRRPRRPGHLTQAQI